MSKIKGDFLGFTFDGVHSSDLGIFRVSDGSRYGENLLPTIQDKTVQIPGADGTYYYGSYYTQKNFNISVAFDNLTEEQLRRIKNLFGDKKIHNLIFDELPYKVYKVKITGTPNLKYICFDGEKKDIGLSYRNQNLNSSYSRKDLYEVQSNFSSGRIYKGEGQLNFITYSPFARSRFKYLDQYTTNNIPEWANMYKGQNDIYYNQYDWAESSGLINSKTKKIISSEINGEIVNTEYYIDICNNGRVLVYNPGDLEIPVNFILKFNNTTARLENFSIYDDSGIKLTLDKLMLNREDSGIRINNKLHLIEGLDSEGKITGNLYNKFKTSGDFFSLPVTASPTFYFYNCVDFFDSVEVEYNYLFF